MQPSDGQNLWQPQQDDTQPVAPQSAVEQQPAQSVPQQPVVEQSQSQSQPQVEPTQEIPTEPNVPQDMEAISWEASESIHHERDGMWFMSFIAIFVVLVGISIWLQQWTFTALLVVMAVALMVYIKRPPRVLRYSLTNSGLQVGEQLYDFASFKSFGILQEGGIFSVMLIPTKRFGQGLTVYFAENDGEKIVDILGSYLPMEDLHLDMLDNVLRRLRL